jgi:hypothetical protein
MPPIQTFRNPIISIWQHAIHKAISQKMPAGAAAPLLLSSTQPEMTEFSSAVEALSKGQAISPKDSAGNVIGDCAKLDPRTKSGYPITPGQLMTTAIIYGCWAASTLQQQAVQQALDPQTWVETLKTGARGTANPIRSNSGRRWCTRSPE